jgi:hypothetical protein
MISVVAMARHDVARDEAHSDAKNQTELVHTVAFTKSSILHFINIDSKIRASTRALRFPGTLFLLSVFARSAVYTSKPMRTPCNPHIGRDLARRAALAILAALTLNAGRLGTEAAQTTAGARDPTPLEQALARWRQGDQAGAVEQFLRIDWKAAPALSPQSPLKTREKDLPGMSAPAREKLMADVLPLLQDLKKLSSAVKEKATGIAGTDQALAKSYLAKLAECGAVIDSPEALKIVQLTAQSLRKMATAEAARK